MMTTSSTTETPVETLDSDDMTTQAESTLPRAWASTRAEALKALQKALIRTREPDEKVAIRRRIKMVYRA